MDNAEWLMVNGFSETSARGDVAFMSKKLSFCPALIGERIMSRNVSDESLARIRNFVEKFCAKSGTTTHPDPSITEAVVLGLAHHRDTLGKPLCPCRFYPDKQEEVKHRTWICACDD